MTAGAIPAQSPALPPDAATRLTVARAVRWPIGFARAHPDLLLLGGLLLIAMLARGALLTRAPLFIRRDSIAYFQVGYEYANGLGFDLPLRRTPLYPLFIAGVVMAFGEDLRGLALAQHLLGLVTVAATYFLGRAMFGRVAGTLAALATALTAPLLIYEHYILAEPLFIPFLTLGLLLVVLAIQRERGWLYLAGGVVLALAALSRPVGQALLPVAPLAILVHYRRLRPAIRPAALVLLGFAIVLVPWMLRSSFTTGRVDGAGAMGQSLVGRIIRHDEGFVLPSPDSPTPANSRQNPEVRKLILTQMNRDARPSAINHRVREVYGLSETEADQAMRDVAIEIFTSQPYRYVEGSLAKLRRLFVGEDERLRIHWATRKDGELRDDWLGEDSIAHLYSPPSAVQEQEFPTAEAVTRIFQPYLWRYLLIPLVLIGIVGGLWLGPRTPTMGPLGFAASPRGPTALLVLATLALVVPSAALVGYVPRYRYPTDPLLAVLAAGGLVIAVGLSRRFLARRRASA